MGTFYTLCGGRAKAPTRSNCTNALPFFFRSSAIELLVRSGYFLKEPAETPAVLGLAGACPWTHPCLCSRECVATFRYGASLLLCGGLFGCGLFVFFVEAFYAACCV